MYGTVESRYNEPPNNEVLSIANDFLYPSHSKIYAKQPRKHTFLMICVPLPGKHISLVIYVPLPGKHIFLVIRMVDGRKQVTT